MRHNELYATEQLFAELALLEYQAQRCKVELVPGQGIRKVIDNAKKFLTGQDQSKENLKAVHAAITLSSSLRLLWFRGIDFTQQLISMNTGDYLYGEKSSDKEIFYKDFEYELFTASMIAESDLRTILPRVLDGNDVICDNVEIQCKHPDTIGKNIQKFARKLSSRCRKNGSIGVLALAIEDAMDFYHETTAEDEWRQWIQRKLNEGEELFDKIIPEALQYSPKVFGVIITSTYFKDLHGQHFNLQLMRMTNSVFCHRPEDASVSDDQYAKLLRLLSVFNPAPNFIKFSGRKVVEINTKPVKLEFDEKVTEDPDID